MPVSSDFVEFICEQLAPLGSIQARSMMGGRTLYCDNVIFALIDNDQLYIKVDASSLPRFKAAGSSLFAPFKDEPNKTMNYARLPDDALDDRESLLAWARLGIEPGQRSKSPQSNAKRPPSKKSTAKKTTTKQIASKLPVKPAKKKRRKQPAPTAGTKPRSSSRRRTK
jgi:DNA transformation protein and related proteins